MAFVDYYKILGVDKNIPQKDVRAAYRKRAKQFHPDLHPNDPKAKAKFQALNEAYEVLSDPDKRAKYDQFGENWKNAGGFGGGGFGGGSAGGAGGDPFEGFDFSSFRKWRRWILQLLRKSLWRWLFPQQPGRSWFRRLWWLWRFRWSW